MSGKKEIIIWNLSKLNNRDRAVITTKKLSLPWNQNLVNHVDWLG